MHSAQYIQMTAFSLKLKLTLIHLELCNACVIVYQTVLFPKISQINKALNMSLVVYPKVKINGHKNGVYISVISSTLKTHIYSF